MTISEKFECFQYFNFETDFLENENLFQKTGVRFLIENTKIENASFLYKTTISEARRQMEWTLKNGLIANNGVLPVTTYFFLKILFQFKNLF